MNIPRADENKAILVDGWGGQRLSPLSSLNLSFPIFHIGMMVVYLTLVVVDIELEFSWEILGIEPDT